MNIEGAIAQCKSLLLQGKQVTAEKVNSLVAAASTFAKYSQIAPSSSFQSSTSGNYTKGKQTVSKYGTD